MDKELDAALVEAVLFLESEPVEAAALARITGLPREAVVEAIAALRDEYRDPRHGLELIDIAGGYTLSPKRELWERLRERYGKRSDARLSRAAMETLAIVAYSQPVTKAEIEGIRGVTADSMIRLLSARGLIREVGKKDAPGRPIQYGTTREFLRLFRLSSIADLPKLDELDQERFELNE